MQLVTWIMLFGDVMARLGGTPGRARAWGADGRLGPLGGPGIAGDFAGVLFAFKSVVCIQECCLHLRVLFALKSVATG